MSTKIKLLIAAIFAAAAFWFYWTPYMAVDNMRTAARNHDAAKLSSYVDYEALRESLKSGFNTKLTNQAVQQANTNPFAAVGAAMAAALVNPLIDALVTPEGVAAMMQGEKPSPELGVKLSIGSANGQATAAQADTDISMAYDGFNRFIVDVKKNDSQEGPTGMVFDRNGLFSWKLSAIRLPG